jgi:class 3 adenylate cyclase
VAYRELGVIELREVWRRYSAGGLEGRWDYGAIGTVTRLALRLGGEARPGHVLATRKVRAAVEALVEAEPGGEIALQGFARPVSTFALLGLWAA